MLSNGWFKVYCKMPLLFYVNLKISAREPYAWESLMRKWRIDHEPDFAMFQRFAGGAAAAAPSFFIRAPTQCMENARAEGESVGWSGGRLASLAWLVGRAVGEGN